MRLVDLMRQFNEITQRDNLARQSKEIIQQGSCVNNKVFTIATLYFVKTN